MNNRIGVLRLSSRFVGNRGRLIVNATWVVVLLALSVTGVALVAGSARAWILFYDGDSVLPVLMARDFFGGVPLHYAFSAVLFFPELTVYFAVAALHLGTQATIIIVGVIWLFLIGLGFRLAVQWAIPRTMPSTAHATEIWRRKRDEPDSDNNHLRHDARQQSRLRSQAVAEAAVQTRSWAPTIGQGSRRARREERETDRLTGTVSGCVGSLAAMGVLVIQIATERSSDRFAIEFASLATSSDYYVSTTLAMILVLGLVARAQTGRATRINGVAIAITALTGVSTLVNPLFIAWCVGPAILGVLTLLLLRRGARLTSTLMSLAALGAGAVLGVLARLPFTPWMTTNDSEFASLKLALSGPPQQYVDWQQSAAYFIGYIGQCLSNVGGVIDLALMLGGVVSAVTVAVIAYRGKHAGMLVFALSILWAVPITLLWPVVMGTESIRYWQAIEFAPLTSVAVLVGWWYQERARAFGRQSNPSRARGGTARRGVVVTVCAVAMAASVLLGCGTSLGATRSRADAAAAASVSCVVDWVNAHPSLYGAGTYWAVRPAKAYVDDPSHLIQITTAFQTHPWLVNREDFTHLTVDYLVQSTDSMLNLNGLAGWHGTAPTVAHCGSFIIQQLSTPLTIVPFPNAAV